VLVDNVKRFSQQTELHPRLPGNPNNDEIVYLDSAFHDMTEAITAAMRKERAIIEKSVDVICSLTADLSFISVSPGVEAAWGYNPTELLSQPLLMILDRKEAERIKQTFDMAKSGSAAVFDSIVHRPDGSLVNSSWSAQWSDEDSCFFCIAHDTTARTRMENLKREFVSMVSHDLRTPLSSILGSICLLSTPQYGSLSTRGLKSVARAERELSRLIELINNLLDIDRLESGKFVLDLHSVSLPPIIEQAIESVAETAQNNEIKILFTPDSGKNTVRADSFRLVQVLVNLLSNAIKFSPAGSIIKIELHTADGHVEVKVIDKGRGVPVEFRQAIFNRFEQVDLTDTTTKKGSGLGLAICKAIIAEHGGEIGVDNNEEQGSTFWFRLPVDQEFVTVTEDQCSDAEQPCAHAIQKTDAVSCTD
jgi:PAS domain S-box-containing protein